MYELRDGMKVKSSDGKSLGKIIRSGPTSLVVEKGLFFTKDYEIARSLVAEVRGDECWLSITEDALRGGAGAEAQDTRTAKIGGAEASRMTLAEEDLEARKRVRDAGEVAVRKEVVTEHRQIDVPVMKEEVHVERAASASAPEGEPFREETIRVPVREEEVEVTKRPKVREEVRVSKTARQEEQRVEGDVRREEARIERTDEHGKYGEEP